MMTHLFVFLSRLRAWLSPRRLDDDFEQELQGHLSLLIEENIRRGMTPEEAARAARLRLGAPLSSRRLIASCEAFPSSRP